MSAVLDCEKPVVGAVNGTAAGIGAHLAFACDLVVAAEEARFIEVFVRRGISPDGGGAYLLPRLIGLQKAKELIFFGDDLHADDAAELGLVNRVVPREQLEHAARPSWPGAWRRGRPRPSAWPSGCSTAPSTPTGSTAFDEEAWAQELIVGTADCRRGAAGLRRAPPPGVQGVLSTARRRPPAGFLRSGRPEVS